jgi:nucleotide-binding universal stress UspA family protein
VASFVDVTHTLGFRRVLVPVAANPESEKAMDVACRVALAGAGVVTAAAVVVVPTSLPLDARMDDEEVAAHRLLERAAAVADSYGVRVSTRSLRARDAASAILAEAVREPYEIVIAGAPRKRATSRGTLVFGSTIEHVLKRAPCRVMLIGAAPVEVYAVNAA